MKKPVSFFQTLAIAATVMLSLASCEDKSPAPEVNVSDFVATVPENPVEHNPTGNGAGLLGQVEYTSRFANNLRFYFPGSEELNNHIALDQLSGGITITNFDYFDFEQRTSVTTQAAADAFNENDEMTTAYFTITINITDIEETAPTLSTTPVTNITATNAESGGTILNDGNGTITEQGIVWSSTNQEPTIDDTKYSSTSGESPFIVYMTNLTSNTTYYVRSYATNIYGTGYGDVQTFKTLLEIGDTHQGGIVAYLLQPDDIGYDTNVQHGIIVATTDQSTSTPWALTLTTTGASGHSIGSGQTNTNAIVANQGDGVYAAKICSDLVIDGYDDWYLPSLEEMGKLYENKHLIGDFATAFYWSSTEEAINTAWIQSFNSNSQTIGTKTDFANPDIHVRAVRSF